MKRKDWAKVAGKIDVAYDILEVLLEDSTLPKEFKSHIRSTQASIGDLSSIAFELSLKKKERKGIGL